MLILLSGYRFLWSYRQVIEEDDHALLVLEYERIHDLHVRLLHSELDLGPML
jgi:hypothetical protein